MVCPPNDPEYGCALLPSGCYSLYHNYIVIPNTDVVIPRHKGKTRGIRVGSKRSYKNKKSFIDFYGQMQENEERRRLKSTRFAANRRYFESLPEDDL
jgi:hypothetical protein